MSGWELCNGPFGLLRFSLCFAFGAGVGENLVPLNDAQLHFPDHFQGD